MLPKDSTETWSRLIRVNKMTDEKSKDKRIVAVASIIVPLAVLLVSTITTRGNLSITLQHIMVVALVFLVLTNLYLVLGEPFIRFFKKMVVSMKDHYVIKKDFKKFSRFADRLEELFESRRTDNIPYALSNLQMNCQEFQDITPSLDDFRDLFVVFRDAVPKLRRNKKYFVVLIRWFESIVSVYNKCLVCKPVERVRRIPIDKVPAHIRELYTECKAVYDRFIQDYTIFAREVNAEFGEKIARDSFQIPKGLEQIIAKPPGVKQQISDGGNK